MAWAIITIYTSKCAQMDPQQLPKSSKFYSGCKKSDIEKTLGGWVPPPLVARRLTFIEDKSSEKRTYALNGHGSAVNDATTLAQISLDFTLFVSI